MIDPSCGEVVLETEPNTVQVVSGYVERKNNGAGISRKESAKHVEEETSTFVPSRTQESDLTC